VKKRQKTYYERHKVEIKEYAKSDRGKAVRRRAYKNYLLTLRGLLQSRFHNMKARCNNPQYPSYKYYGGRGIKLLFSSCEELYDYVVNTLGIDTYEILKPLQIHRIDNNGHYEPNNIQFLTSAEHGYAHALTKTGEN
jgi:hypothetical protein